MAVPVVWPAQLHDAMIAETEQGLPLTDVDLTCRYIEQAALVADVWGEWMKPTWHGS